MNLKRTLQVSLLCVAAACTKQEVTQTTTHEPKPEVVDAFDAAVPIGRDDPAAREQERFDEKWRELNVFRDVKPAAPVAMKPAEVDVTFAPNGKESFKGLDPGTMNAAPVVVPIKGDVAGPSVLKTQVYLDRLQFSIGAIDGRWGRNSSIALWWYQRTRGIEAAEPGALDEPTFRSLASAASGVPALVEKTLTEDDVKGPFVTIPEDVYEKEKLTCLCYESKVEQLAERFHTTVELLEQVNPKRKLADLNAGDSLWVPNVREPVTADRHDIARVVVSIKGNTLNAFDAAGNLVFHAPTTLGSKYDPSPNETVTVKRVAFKPNFHYQPTLFHEVPDTDPEANLPPGPNSPVGVVWIALSKPHFGIHGTSDPESIGYASSHGCVRLTNWDAHEVAHRVKPGVTVEFLDTVRAAAN